MRYFSLLVKETEIAVLKEYGISKTDFKSNLKSRRLEYKEPRQIVIYILRKHTNASSARIGMEYNKDHATVLSAVKVIENRIDVDRPFIDLMNRVYQYLAPLNNLCNSVTFVCNNCGSVDVTMKIDYNPNTRKILEVIYDENYPGFCEHCGETTILNINEYERNNKMETVPDRVQEVDQESL